MYKKVLSITEMDLSAVIDKYLIYKLHQDENLLYFGRYEAYREVLLMFLRNCKSRQERKDFRLIFRFWYKLEIGGRHERS